MQPGRDDAPLPFRAGRPVTVPAEGPGDRVQDRSLSLAVFSADDSKAIGVGGKGDGFDPLDVFQLQAGDFDAHFFASSS